MVSCCVHSEVASHVRHPPPLVVSPPPPPLDPPTHLQLPRPRCVSGACDGQSVGHNHHALRSHRAAAANPKASRAEQARRWRRPRSRQVWPRAAASGSTTTPRRRRCRSSSSSAPPTISAPSCSSGGRSSSPSSHACSAACSDPGPSGIEVKELVGEGGQLVKLLVTAVAPQSFHEQTIWKIRRNGKGWGAMSARQISISTWGGAAACMHGRTRSAHTGSHAGPHGRLLSPLAQYLIALGSKAVVASRCGRSFPSPHICHGPTPVLVWLFVYRLHALMSPRPFANATLTDSRRGQ